MKLYTLRYQQDGKTLGESKITAELTTMPREVIIDNTLYLVAYSNITTDEPTVVQCELVEWSEG